MLDDAGNDSVADASNPHRTSMLRRRVNGHSVGVKRLVPIVLAGLVLSAGAGSSATPVARVRVVDTTPLAIVGSGFKAGEIVRVTVFAPQAATRTTLRRTTATRAGSFRLRFPRISLGDCDSYGLRAVGNKGSRAAYKPPQPMCGAIPQPVG